MARRGGPEADSQDGEILASGATKNEEEDQIDYLQLIHICRVLAYYIRE